MKKILLGCDPELFLVDATGAFVSSIGKIGGTKECPRPVPIGEGFAVQEDNVALEYNIPPANNADDFIAKIRSIMGFLGEQVAKQGLHFSDQSAVFFPKDQLNDPRALEFGCEPDYNAWTKAENPRPKADDATLRSCGGHVHVGAQDVDVINSVKLMDLYLGVPSVLIDKGDLRKKLYGKRGAYRPKPYGFEYRTLSNFWVVGGDELIKWVWNNTQLALDAEHIRVDEEEDVILDAIDNNNKNAAAWLIDKYDIPLPTNVAMPA
jgi:hypothetical protein